VTVNATHRPATASPSSFGNLVPPQSGGRFEREFAKSTFTNRRSCRPRPSQLPLPLLHLGPAGPLTNWYPPPSGGCFEREFAKSTFTNRRSCRHRPSRPPLPLLHLAPFGPLTIWYPPQSGGCFEREFAKSTFTNRRSCRHRPSRPPLPLLHLATRPFSHLTIWAVWARWPFDHFLPQPTPHFASFSGQEPITHA